jgi:multidrug efflux pump subunit AcrB
MKITLFPEMRLNNITTTTRRNETTKIHIELQLERDRDEEEKEIRNIKNDKNNSLPRQFLY